MNDLEILDHFGPTSAEPSDAALAAARTRLSAAIETSPAVRRPRRLPLLVAAAAAAAVGIGVVPALVGSDDSIALAAVDPLTFPVTPTWLPEGAGDPVFHYERAWQLASYGEGKNHVSVSVVEEDADWDGPPANAEAVDVNGQPGMGYASREHLGTPETVPAYTVYWRAADGDELRVTGFGSNAERATVERVADSVTDETQPVDLFLTVAPEGWQVSGYKSDHHILLIDPTGETGGDGTDLSVQLIDHVSLTREEYGARDVQEVTVDSRPALLARTVDMQNETVHWMLQTTTADGTAFHLNAPGRMTEEQVIEVAAGVRHR